MNWSTCTPSPAQVRNLIERHSSHSLAYSALQPDLQYFGDPLEGLIAYRKRLGSATVLGDPLASSHQRKALIETFRKQQRRHLFLQISGDTASCLRSLGYKVSPLGAEAEIGVQTFSLDGKTKADLRNHQNCAREAGVEVREVADAADDRRELRAISEAWLQRKRNGRELVFLARPFQTTPEPGTRIFVAWQRRQRVAFVLFDPLYASGKQRGYTVTTLRQFPAAPKGVITHCVLTALEAFRNEGLQTLNLGIVPFEGMADRATIEGRGALPTYATLCLLQRQGDLFHNFGGLAFAKSRYRPTLHPVYVAHDSRSGIWELWAGARACGLV